MKAKSLLAMLTGAALALTACEANDVDGSAEGAPTSDVETTSATPSANAAATETVAPVELVDEFGHPVPETNILGTPSELTGQAWADEKISQWWKLEGANSFAGYLHPYSSIESWSSPREGDLVITLEPGAEIQSDAEADSWGSLAQITDVGAFYLYCAAPELDTMTAQTADGSESYTTHRDSVPGESDTSSKYCY